jgi:hypothetical protein
MLEDKILLAGTLPSPEPTQTSDKAALTIGWSAAALVCAFYLVYFSSLQTPPLQDFPNHLARAVVLSDLLFAHGERFGQMFSLSLVPVPYLLHDLILAGLVRLFGPRVGGTVFIDLVLLSLPLALMYYMWAARLAPHARPLVFVLAFFLATDTYFLLGFMAFRLSLASLIVCFGLIQRLRTDWSGKLFAVYVVALAGGYLLHLTAVMFFAAILAISSFVRLVTRASTLGREVLLCIPLGFILTLHVALFPRPAVDIPPTYQFYWGTWAKKLQHLTFEYTRFGSHLDRPMLVLLLACLVWAVRRHFQLSRFQQPAVLEALAIAVAFAGVYFVLPEYYSDSAYVDVRALPVLLIMVILACLNLPGSNSSGRDFASWSVMGLAVALSIINLSYLMRHIDAYRKPIAQYRELGSAIPSGSYVLPVYTVHKDGELRGLLHASGYLVADRTIVVPYLFSADRGDPMKYFSYRARPYRPDEQWYIDRQNWDRASEQSYTVAGRVYTWKVRYSEETHLWTLADLIPVDWNQVACRYDYLLMTKPVDMRLIGIPVRSVRENEAAALVAVDKSVCHPGVFLNRPSRLSGEH